MDGINSSDDKIRGGTRKRFNPATVVGVIALIIIDQTSKFIITKYVPLHASLPVIKNFFDLTNIRNTGIAFGLFSENPTRTKTILMSSLTFISVIIIVYLLHKIKNSNRLFRIGLGLIVSGAFGNLIDRIFRNGGVVDFLDLHWYDLHWPAFNIADSAISAGVCLLLIDTFFAKKKDPDEK